MKNKILAIVFFALLSTPALAASTTNTATNIKLVNASDGFTAQGGTTLRKLTITGSDITLTGSGSTTYTVPNSAGDNTFVTDDDTATLTNKTLTTPTIVSGGFSNMNMTHVDATQGGQISMAGLSWIQSTWVSSDYVVSAVFDSFATVTGLSLTLPASSTWLVTIVGSVTVTATAGLGMQIDGAHISAAPTINYEYQTQAATALTTSNQAGNDSSTGNIMTSAATRFLRVQFEVTMDGTGGAVALQAYKHTSGSMTFTKGFSMVAVRVN